MSVHYSGSLTFLSLFNISYCFLTARSVINIPQILLVILQTSSDIYFYIFSGNSLRYSLNIHSTCLLCVILRIFSLRTKNILRKGFIPPERRLQLTFFPKRPSFREVINVAWRKSGSAVRSPRAFSPLTSLARRDMPQRLLVTRWTGIVKCFFFSNPLGRLLCFFRRLCRPARESFLFSCTFPSFITLSSSLKKHDY